MARRGGILAGSAVVAGAVIYLAASGVGDNLVYFLTPSELLAKGEAARGVPFRLSGRVEEGSLRWDAPSLDLRFRVRDDSVSVPVRSTGSPPQMFHEGIDVVLEGALDEGGVFRAHTVMVKHSNEYAPPDEAGHPADRFPGLRGAPGGGS